MEDYQSKLGTFRDLSVPWIRRIFVVGLGMAVINQISGVNAIMYYGTSSSPAPASATKAR